MTWSIAVAGRRGITTLLAATDTVNTLARHAITVSVLRHKLQRGKENAFESVDSD